MDLEKLAMTVGHDRADVAGSNLYHQVYDELEKKKYAPITDAWIKNKHSLSAWLEKYFEKNNLGKGKTLSIGCGLGIVEQPLIDKGFHIDVQECQDKSIHYLSKKYPQTYKKTRFILSQDLKEIDDSIYDSILAITSTYCLTDLEVNAFLTSVSRILKQGGVFIWYETPLTWFDLFHYLKQSLLMRKSEGVLWGWKRSKNHFIRSAKKCNFSVKEFFYFDKKNNGINPSTLFDLPYDDRTSWQMMVFKKND
ncbi:MAG: methyltransferase domain-containing protein [Alphaproteobacteria bacterium]|nr:methyltransferase domain-containing protein [Alphaproteobacteria bacterium]